jgi:hypothetical protein
MKIYDIESQYLTVAYAKGFGLDPMDRVVAYDRLLSSREETGLRPLLLYSLIVPAYSLYVRLLVNRDAPISLSVFLRHAWSQTVCLGMPMKLETKQAVLDGCSGVLRWLDKQGIEIGTASSTRSIDAFARSALDLGFALTWPAQKDRSHGRRELPRKLDDCNAALQAYDSFKRSIPADMTSMGELTYRAWMARDIRFCSEEPLDDDWDCSGIKEPAQKRPRPELALTTQDRNRGVIEHIEGIKELVLMWPNGPSAFFKQTGIAKSDFDFWTAGRARLDSRGLDALVDVAALEYCDAYGSWELGGGYLLLASKARQVELLYNVLSHGGDLIFSFEILGPGGELPPMRFLAFCACAGRTTVVLFERDGDAEKRLNSSDLINLQEPERATTEVWETVLHIVENRLAFDRPDKVGAAFGGKHFQWLQSKGIDAGWIR